MRTDIVPRRPDNEAWIDAPFTVVLAPQAFVLAAQAIMLLSQRRAFPFGAFGPFAKRLDVFSVRRLGWPRFRHADVMPDS